MNEKAFKYKPTKFMAKGNHYDEAAADYVVNFIQQLKHTKGDFYGQPFLLLPWQEQIIRDIFGTLKPNGYRQFNTAYVEIPKKNGKALALDTPIATPEGWTTMGELKPGDSVFGSNGKPCHVVAVTDIQENRPCYEMKFSNGETIIADEQHEWLTITNDRIIKVRITKDISDTLLDENGTINHSIMTRSGVIHIVEVNKTKSVPVRCIQVDAPDHLYLAGKKMIPTHNSELAAAVALYLLCGDNEQRAEVYSCAADRGQASIVFDVASDMVRQCPALMKRCKILDSKKRIEYEPTGSFYQVLSAEVAGKSGFNVSGLIFDELWVQKNRQLWDMMTQGTSDARKNPLHFVITTAGDNINSVCYEQHVKAEEILKGKRKDQTFYPCIFGAPMEADWTKKSVWKKANPSIDVTIDMEKVEAAYKKALETPSDEKQFRQLRLNQWQQSAVRWMPSDKWNKCAQEINLDELKDRVCYGGLDLSMTTDLTAFSLVFPPLEDGQPYIAMVWCWCPEEAVELRTRRDHVPYADWVKLGIMETTPGNVVDYRYIINFIRELSDEFNIQGICYDRWNASMAVQELEGDFEMIPFGQGFASMSPPTKDLMELVLKGEFIHDKKDKKLDWMMDNACAETDASGNIKLSKKKSTEKIDGVIAMIMALSQAIRCGQNTNKSVYDERDMIFI